MTDHLPERKPNRLPTFDYASNGAYFITLCTQNKRCILSTVAVGATFGRPPVIELTAVGAIVEREILRLNEAYENLRVEHYVIMPNHVHLLLMIDASGGRPQVAPTVSRAMKQFKGAVTKHLGASIWQKGFHDHVIRNESDYAYHLQYIDENPKKWLLGKDEYFA